MQEPQLGLFRFDPDRGFAHRPRLEMKISRCHSLLRWGAAFTWEPPMKLLLLGACFALAATASFAEDAAVLKRGESIVVRNCARCHATARTGESRHPEAPQFRTLGK